MSSRRKQIEKWIQVAEDTGVDQRRFNSLVFAELRELWATADSTPSEVWLSTCGWMTSQAAIVRVGVSEADALGEANPDGVRVYGPFMVHGTPRRDGGFVRLSDVTEMIGTMLNEHRVVAEYCGYSNPMITAGSAGAVGTLGKLLDALRSLNEDPNA